MLAAILVMWFVGIPLAVIAVTGFAHLRRGATRARIHSDDAHLSVPLLTSVPTGSCGRRPRVHYIDRRSMRTPGTRSRPLQRLR